MREKPSRQTPAASDDGHASLQLGGSPVEVQVRRERAPERAAEKREQRRELGGARGCGSHHGARGIVQRTPRAVRGVRQLGERRARLLDVFRNSAEFRPATSPRVRRARRQPSSARALPIRRRESHLCRRDAWTRPRRLASRSAPRRVRRRRPPPRRRRTAPQPPRRRTRRRPPARRSRRLSSVAHSAANASASSAPSRSKRAKRTPTREGARTHPRLPTRSGRCTPSSRRRGREDALDDGARFGDERRRARGGFRRSSPVAKAHAETRHGEDSVSSAVVPFRIPSTTAECFEFSKPEHASAGATCASSGARAATSASTRARAPPPSRSPWTPPGLSSGTGSAFATALCTSRAAFAADGACRATGAGAASTPSSRLASAKAPWVAQRNRRSEGLLRLFRLKRFKNVPLDPVQRARTREARLGVGGGRLTARLCLRSVKSRCSTEPQAASSSRADASPHHRVSRRRRRNTARAPSSVVIRVRGVEGFARRGDVRRLVGVVVSKKHAGFRSGRPEPRVRVAGVRLAGFARRPHADGGSALSRSTKAFFLVAFLADVLALTETSRSPRRRRTRPRPPRRARSERRRKSFCQKSFWFRDSRRRDSRRRDRTLRLRLRPRFVNAEPSTEATRHGPRHAGLVYCFRSSSLSAAKDAPLTAFTLVPSASSSSAWGQPRARTARDAVSPAATASRAA